MADDPKLTVILVVDDDPDDVVLMRDACTVMGGIAPVVCRSASEARAYLKGSGFYADRRTHPMPHAIVCDMNLGTDSGLELLDWAKGFEPSRAIPFAMLSGIAGPRELLAAKQKGAARVFRKPEKFSDLKVLLDQWLRSIGLRQT